MITVYVTSRQLHAFLQVAGHAFATGEVFPLTERESELRRTIYLTHTQHFARSHAPSKDRP